MCRSRIRHTLVATGTRRATEEGSSTGDLVARTDRESAARLGKLPGWERDGGARR
jgi:hypothetical protein